MEQTSSERNRRELSTKEKVLRGVLAMIAPIVFGCGSVSKIERSVESANQATRTAVSKKATVVSIPDATRYPVFPIPTLVDRDQQPQSEMSPAESELFHLIQRSSPDNITGLEILENSYSAEVISAQGLNRRSFPSTSAPITGVAYRQGEQFKAWRLARITLTDNDGKTQTNIWLQEQGSNLWLCAEYGNTRLVSYALQRLNSLPDDEPGGSYLSRIRTGYKGLASAIRDPLLGSRYATPEKASRKGNEPNLRPRI